MNKVTILAAAAAAMLSATSVSALSYLDNFGTGVEGTEEGTERVTDDSTTETTPSRGNGNGGGKGKNK